MRQTAKIFSLFIFVIAALRGAFAQFHTGMQRQGGWGHLPEPDDVDAVFGLGDFYFDGDGELSPEMFQARRFVVFAPGCIPQPATVDRNHVAVKRLKCVVEAFRSGHHITQSGGKMQYIDSAELSKIKLALQAGKKYKGKTFDRYLNRFLSNYINALRGVSSQGSSIGALRKLQRDIISNFGENHADIMRLNVLKMFIDDAITALNRGSLHNMLDVIDRIHGEFFFRQEQRQRRYPNSM